MSILQNIRNVGWLLVLILFGFQAPMHLQHNDKSAGYYSPEFPKVTKPKDKSFISDSLRAIHLGRLSLKYYNVSRWDSFLYNARQLRLLGEKLLSQQIDSTLIEFWYYGYADEGQAMVYLGEAETGFAMLNEAFSIRSRLLKDNETSVSFYNILGYMHGNLFNDPERALDYYWKAVYVANQGPASLVAKARNNLILGYCRIGDFRQAEACFKEAFYGKASHNSDKAWPVIFLAREYINVGDFENARRILLLGDQLDAATTDQQFLLIRILAQVERELNNWDACAVQIGKAELFLKTHAAEFRSGPRIQDLTWEKALYHQGKGRLSQSIALQRACIRMSEDSGMGRHSLKHLTRYQTLAETLLLADSLNAAKDVIAILLERETGINATAAFMFNPPATAFTHQPYHLRTLVAKGRYLEQLCARTGDMKQLENALEVYALADTLVDHLRDSYRGIGSKNQLSGIAKPIFKRTIECAYRLWQTTKDRRYLDRAWRAAEKSKSVALLESLRETEAGQSTRLRPEDITREKNIKRDLSFYEKLIFEERSKKYPDVIRMAEWNHKLSKAKQAQDSLLLIYQKRYPDYYRLRHRHHIAPMDTVQAQLPDDNALISYFQSDTVLFTFLIDRQHGQMFRSVVNDAWQKKLELMQICLRDYPSGRWQADTAEQRLFQQFTTSAHALYKVLLDNPLQQTVARKLLIVSDEQLGYIPFAALLCKPVPANTPVGYRDLPYLVREASLRFEYSGTLLVELPDRSVSNKQYLGMAPTYNGSLVSVRNVDDSLRFVQAFPNLRGGDLPALRYNIEEVKSVHARYKGSHALGMAATESFFRKYAPQSAILHLAMHALTNDSDPLYSTLVFAQTSVAGQTKRQQMFGTDCDGLLHAYEIYGMRLQAALAVLSACNTGAGKIVRGEGIMSLARAFRAAGCTNVLMSLWPVNDAASKNIMVNFFDNLSHGMGQTSALQRAQLDFLQQETSDVLTHPYFWANFSMIGSDQPLPVQHQSIYLIILLFLLNAMLLALIFHRSDQTVPLGATE